MVHPVKNGISPWRKIGTSLADPCKNVKELLPIFVHNEHLMGSIPVKEKALAK
jgi:hypothetical protein